MKFDRLLTDAKFGGNDPTLFAIEYPVQPSSIILIMAPIVYPAAIALGVNPVHLGILIDVNMEVGLCHPPVGLNLYVASGISRLGIAELTKAVWPWLVTMLVFLVIVTYWPWLTLVVPRTLGMM